MDQKKCRKKWDSMNSADRRFTLESCGIWSPGSFIVDHECQLKWNDLLPSTQQSVMHELDRIIALLERDKSGQK